MRIAVPQALIKPTNTVIESHKGGVIVRGRMMIITTKITNLIPIMLLLLLMWQWIPNYYYFFKHYSLSFIHSFCFHHSLLPYHIPHEHWPPSLQPEQKCEDIRDEGEEEEDDTAEKDEELETLRTLKGQLELQVELVQQELHQINTFKVEQILPLCIIHVISLFSHGKKMSCGFLQIYNKTHNNFVFLSFMSKGLRTSNDKNNAGSYQVGRDVISAAADVVEGGEQQDSTQLYGSLQRLQQVGCHD